MPDVSPLTIAAASAVGPIRDGNEAAWFATVKRIAVEMSFLDADVQTMLTTLSEAKPFNGTVLSVDDTSRSTRGNVILFTGTDQVRDGMEPGTERVQTDRGDTPDGAAMIARCKALIGHKVTVWRVNDKMDNGSGHTFRRVVRIIDNGPDPDRARSNGGTAAERTQQRPAERPAQERPTQQQRTERPERPAQQPQQEQAPQRHLQSVPTTPDEAAPSSEPAAEEAWPEVAGQAAMLDEVAAKNQVLAAAHGDKAKALAAWEHIGNPSTTVSQADLNRALQFVAAS